MAGFANSRGCFISASSRFSRLQSSDALDGLLFYSLQCFIVFSFMRMDINGRLMEAMVEVGGGRQIVLLLMLICDS